MRAGIGEFLYSMAGLPPLLLVIVREKTDARQGPRNGRRSPGVLTGKRYKWWYSAFRFEPPRDNSPLIENREISCTSRQAIKTGPRRPWTEDRKSTRLNSSH